MMFCCFSFAQPNSDSANRRQTIVSIRTTWTNNCHPRYEWGLKFLTVFVVTLNTWWEIIENPIESHEITGQDGSWFHMIADSSSNGSFPPTQKWLCGPPTKGWSMVNLIHDSSNNLPCRHSLQNSSTAIRNTWKHCKMEWGCARLHLHRLIEYPAACPCCRTAVIWLSRPQWEGKKCSKTQLWRCTLQQITSWTLANTDGWHTQTRSHYGSLTLLCLLSAVLVF